MINVIEELKGFEFSKKNIAAAFLSLVAIVICFSFFLWFFLPDQTKILRLASGTSGGTYNSFAHALSKIVNKHSKTIQIRVLASSGANDNVKRVSSGKAELGFIQSDTVVDRDIKIVAQLFPEVFHLIARNKSKIKSVSDLKGKRIALMPVGAGSNSLFANLMKHYQIEPTDLKIQHVSLNKSIEALRAGKVDALFVVMAMGNEKLKSVIKEQDVNLVPIGQADSIALFDPALRSGRIPVGAYSGEKPVPNKPIQIIQVDSLLAVHQGLDDKHIKELTRILFEKRQELLRIIPQGAFVSAPSDFHKLAFDIHGGAMSFYNRDEPPFIVEYAEPMAFAMSVILLIASGLWQAKSWLSDARKNRADHYNLELIEIIKSVEDATSSQEIEKMRLDLFRIFQEVLIDLDNDRIEEKSLQSFSFAWGVASSTINHRQIVLSNQKNS